MNETKQPQQQKNCERRVRKRKREGYSGGERENKRKKKLCHGCNETALGEIAVDAALLVAGCDGWWQWQWRVSTVRQKSKRRVKTFC